jgi:hypothetical protein
VGSRGYVADVSAAIDDMLERRSCDTYNTKSKPRKAKTKPKPVAAAEDSEATDDDERRKPR